MNTSRPSLLNNNPFVDIIGHKNEGVFLGYPAPAEGIAPTKHHIISDWEIVCKAYNLRTKKPILQPELYVKDLPSKRNVIGVQTIHKGLWHRKKVWPFFEQLSKEPHFEFIPQITSGDKMLGLIKKIAEYTCVVCAEGGISHIAKALDIPAIVLFGGWANPKWNGYEDQINLVSIVDCSYCYNDIPCKGDYKCWKTISVNYVKEIALKMIE